jgi:hypothetical protein
MRLLLLLERYGIATGRPADWLVLPRLRRPDDRTTFAAFAGHSRGPFTSKAFANGVARVWTARTPDTVTWEALPADQFEVADAPLPAHTDTLEGIVEGQP